MKQRSLGLALAAIGVAAAAAQPEVRALTRLPPGHTLDQLVGMQRFATLEHLARRLGLDPAFLRGAQPWYAATTLDAVYLMRLGFDPDRGVDAQMARQRCRLMKPTTSVRRIGC